MAERQPLKAELSVYTVGHSNHDVDQVIGLLKLHQIQIVADVRSSPYSQWASQFNREPFERALAAHSIRYLFLGDRVGGRPKDGAFYDADGHVLYDRVAQSARFQGGISDLLESIRSRRVALFCSEEDPTQCHRRLLVGRVLTERGVDVRHIRGDGRIQSEQEIAEEEEFQQTGGQMSLFEEEPAPWRSTQSVSPRKAPPSSSRP